MAANKNKEKSKQELFQAILSQCLKDEDNKYCADCEGKGPRWASWNIGVFLCIRCAGCHRNLGVHISRVKSVNLDSWTEEQVSIMQQMGNRKAKLIYEALLPENFRRPQTDSSLEQFIRAKYEHKRYLDRSVPFEMPKPKPLDTSFLPAQDTSKQRHSAIGGIGQRASGGGILLPPVPTSGHHIQRHHQPQSAPQPVQQSPGTARTATGNKSDILGFFDDDNQSQPNAGRSGLEKGVSGITLTPPEGAAKVPPQQQGGTMTHSATTSNLADDLSFLAPAAPSSHPQQHHQRSVSGFDLMGLGASSNGNGGGNSSDAAPNASSNGSSVNDILSLYKQQPSQPSLASNFPMYSSASQQGAPAAQPQSTFHSQFGSFGAAPAPPQMTQATMMQNQGGFMGGAGGGAFGGMPQQQQYQQPFPQTSSASQAPAAPPFASTAAPAFDMFDFGAMSKSQQQSTSSSIPPSTAQANNGGSFEAIWN